MAWLTPPFHIGLCRLGGPRRRRRLAGRSRPAALGLKEASAVQQLDSGGQLQALEDLREELRTLSDCLCAAGALTAVELSMRRQQRLGAARMRTLLTQPASAKRLAETLGLEPVGKLSATCSAVARTFCLAVGGEVGALPKESGSGPIVKRLFAWPPLSPPASPAASPSSEPMSLAGPFSRQTSLEATGSPVIAVAESKKNESSETVTMEPDSNIAKRDLERHDVGKLCSTDKPDADEHGSQKPEDDLSHTERPPEVVDDKLVGCGGAASLLSAASQSESQTSFFFGRLFLTRESPTALDQGAHSSDTCPAVIARRLETLADSETQITEGPADAKLKQVPEKTHDLTSESPHSDLQEGAKKGDETQQHGSTVRFLGRILGYGSSLEVTGPLRNSLTGIHHLGREVGRAAGLTAACQISQTSKTYAEALASYLSVLRDDGPFVYVCGGSCGIAVDSAERFCPGTGLWESLPPMCVPRKACTAASVGGRFYVLGGVDVPRYSACGYSDSLQQPLVMEHRNRPECFDPVTNTWELLPPVNRTYTHAAAASNGGFLYVFGGLSFGSVLDQAHRFDPVRHTWESLESMPTPRFECAAAAARGLLYVLGGANTCGEPLAVAESYNPITGSWCSLPCMAEARYGCSAASLNGRVYVFGGHGIWENLSSAETYDPEEDHWTSLPPMSVRRNRCGAAVACGKIYVFGGHTNGQDIITIERLDPKTGSWEVAALMARPRNHCMVATVQP